MAEKILDFDFILFKIKENAFLNIFSFSYYGENYLPLRQITVLQGLCFDSRFVVLSVRVCVALSSSKDFTNCRSPPAVLFESSCSIYWLSKKQLAVLESNATNGKNLNTSSII